MLALILAILPAAARPPVYGTSLLSGFTYVSARPRVAALPDVVGVFLLLTTLLILPTVLLLANRVTSRPRLLPSPPPLV